MNVLIAVDSFKGTLTSKEVAEIIKHNIDPSIKTDIIAIADGGEGTVDSLCYATQGSKTNVTVKNAFGENIKSYFCRTGDKKTAIVEIALSSGLGLIHPLELNPLKTTSYGLGETIKEALSKNIEKLVIGIGGSSSNDGGAGMMQALGVNFFDKDDELIKEMNGETIKHVERIDFTNLDQRIKDVYIEVACDVDNPLLGKDGCAEIYSRQKGATELMVKLLEQNMKHFSSVVSRSIGKDYTKVPGAGAAGGLGFGLLSVLGAHLMSGLDVIADATNLEQRIEKADIVITGEGSFDSQSLHGKAPVKVAKLARKHQKRVIGIFGLCDIDSFEELFDEIYCVVPDIAAKEESLRKPKESLTQLVKTIKLI